MRNWSWQKWLVLIGGIIIVILLIVVAVIISKPEAFRPPPPEVALPTVGLPPVIEGAPDFPTLEEVRIPLAEIQGIDIDRGADLVARGGITRFTNLTEFEAKFTTLAANGQNLNYYDPELNQFYQIDKNGVVQKIGSKKFAAAETIVWAPDSESTIIEFPDGSNVVYNFETEEQISLPAHWQNFSFAPDSDNIAFKSIALDPNENWLAVSQLNGSRARRIEHLGKNQDIVDVEWAPNNQVIGTFVEQDGLSRSKLFFLGFNGENFKLSNLHGKKFEGSWSPTGEQLVYSVMHEDTNFNPSLWVVDGTGPTMGQNRKHINLATWSHKCTFASDTVMYCGVPTNLPRGAGLIPRVAEDVPDELYKIDLVTGTKTRIAIPDSNLQVNTMQVSEDGSYLYILDGFSNRVKKVDLE